MRRREMPPPDDLSAVILAEGPHASRRVAGLSLSERARRVAIRVGAGRVVVIHGAEERPQLARWLPAGGALLVIRAGDQLVHTPLVEPLLAASGARVVAVTPGDEAYAGALLARGDDAAALAAALARGDDDRELAATWLGEGAAAVPHGAIARHPVTSPDQARAAAGMLYGILHKAQDNVITRYLFRPVSSAMTRVLVHTPITPNQVSLFVAILCGLGLWLTARGSMTNALLGSVVILIATYVDCVDGEIARLKLLSSKFGAWFDTIVDELCSVGQVFALGWHCHLWFGPGYFGDLGFDPWLAAVWLSAFTFPLSIYCVYYNIIVVVGSANSQDYVHRFVIVPGEQPGTRRLRPAPVQERVRPTTWYGKFIVEWTPHIIRRDFITWATVILAIFGLTQVAFLWLALGGAVTAPVVGYEHVRLRLLRRQVNA